MNESKQYNKAKGTKANKRQGNQAATLLTLTACMALGFWQWQQQQSLSAWELAFQKQTQTIQDLHMSLTHLQQQAHAPEKAWRIQQAFDYTKMAQVKYLWEYQPGQAKALLRLSLESLALLDTPKLKGLIQDNINALNLPTQKTIHQALLDTKKQISQLDLITPTMTLNDESIQSSPRHTNWRERIQEKLNKAIIIRHTHETLKPMLPEAQHNILKANLTVGLDMAQISLLHQDPEGFQHNLDRCLEAVTIVPQNDSTRLLTKQLQRLKTLIADYPSINLEPVLKAFEHTLLSLNQHKSHSSPADLSPIDSDDHLEVSP